MTSKPVTLAIKDLNKAVQEASSRLAVKPEPGIHLGPIIMGIILRPPIPEIKTVEEVATNLAGHIQTAHAAALGGAKLEPAVLIRPGGPIICGFMPPENVTVRE